MTTTKIELPVLKELPTEKHHISYSEMVDWIDCSFRHKLKHIKKIELDGPNQHTEYGGILHDVIEKYLLGENELNADFVGDQVEIALAALPNFKEDPKVWAKTVKPIFEELPVFLKKTFPDYSIVAAEYPLMESLEKKPGRFFKGFIDCILKINKPDPKGEKPPEEIYYVLDWKTSAWGWTGEKKRDQTKQMQLVLYRHFWSLKLGIDPAKVKCGWVILKREAEPGQHIEFVPFDATEELSEKAIKTVYSMIGSLEKNLFTKNRNSCRFCVYFNTEHCT